MRPPSVENMAKVATDTQKQKHSAQVLKHIALWRSLFLRNGPGRRVPAGEELFVELLSCRLQVYRRRSAFERGGGDGGGGRQRPRSMFEPNRDQAGRFNFAEAEVESFLKHRKPTSVHSGSVLGSLYRLDIKKALYSDNNPSKGLKA